MKTLRRHRAPARKPKPGAPSAPTMEVAERNRVAVSHAIGASVHPKLTLGAPDDAQEHEADRFAAQVMQSPAPQEAVQRKCAECAEKDEEEVHRKPAPTPMQKPEDEDDEKDKDKVRRKEDGAGGGVGHVAATTAASIAQARGGGHALPAGERGFFETRTGASFGHVRVHTDDASAKLSARLSARAFTVGRDVFFGAGEYRPGTTAGRWLLAHELGHVGQQGHGTVRRWQLGAAPGPLNWQVVADPEHLRRLDLADGIVRGVLGSRRCQNFFRNTCTTGGANPLQDTFDNAQVYLRPEDDNAFGANVVGTNIIAYNQRAFRIGHQFMASTLLHEISHACRPGAGNNNANELLSERAVERCRLYTPWIDSVSPRRGAANSRVVISGWNFGPVRGPADSVQVGGVNANIVGWQFLPGTSSMVEVTIEVPAGARSGPIRLFNNRVPSNAVNFTVT